MVIIQVMGGLGNQLQQYALYRKYRNLGVKAKLDISWFSEHSLQNENDSVKAGTVTQRRLELDNFDRLRYEVCTPKEKAELIGTDKIWGKLRRKLLPFTVHWFKESKMYHPEILDFRNMYLSGYFACEKYYADILSELREELQFPQNGNPENVRLLKKMQEQESVSLHVRRGDYLNPENAAIFGNICTDAYYQSAITYIKENCRNPHFYVFSDDIAYVREHFKGEEYTVVNVNQGKHSFYDMWLMSNCKHNICANSTFSFWGARLNANKQKRMLRPTIQKNSQVFEKRTMEDWWKGWIFVSPEGNIC